MNTTPVSLLMRLRSPDQSEAWGRFVALYTPLLYRWACQTGLQPQDAADLVQEVFVVLIRKLPEFVYDERRSFRAWLHTVTLNLWRNRRRQRAATPQDNRLGPLANLAGPDDLAELEEAEYRQSLVRRALELMRAEFPDNVWKACWEYVVCERPPADVAHELGISVNAVYLAKSRVLARLRDELTGLLD